MVLVKTGRKPPKNHQKNTKKPPKTTKQPTKNHRVCFFCRLCFLWTLSGSLSGSPRRWRDMSPMKVGWVGGFFPGGGANKKKKLMFFKVGENVLVGQWLFFWVLRLLSFLTVFDGGLSLSRCAKRFWDAYPPVDLFLFKVFWVPSCSKLSRAGASSRF